MATHADTTQMSGYRKIDQGYEISCYSLTLTLPFEPAKKFSEPARIFLGLRMSLAASGFT